MEAARPAGVDIPKGAIGLNLSPVIAKAAGWGSCAGQVNKAAELLRSIKKEFKKEVWLLPHSFAPGANDHAFLKNVAECAGPGGTHLIGPDLSASQIKWVIGQMDVFIGARTHSIIAGMSSLVPTVSLVYSPKGTGINRDVFDNIDLTLCAKDIDPRKLVEKTAMALSNRQEIINRLSSSMERIKQEVRQSCEILKGMVGR